MKIDDRVLDGEENPRRFQILIYNVYFSNFQSRIRILHNARVFDAVADDCLYTEMKERSLLEMAVCLAEVRCSLKSRLGGT